MRHPSNSSYSIERLFEDIRGNLTQNIKVSVVINRFESRGFLNRILDSLRVVKFQGDVNHITGDVHYLTYFLRSRRTLLTIHDCVSLDERLKGLRKWIFWLLWYWVPARRCALISVISESTRLQVLKYTGCHADKVRVVPDFVFEEFKFQPRIFRIHCPRILHVGTKLNKNLERHASALEGISCKMVIIGKLLEQQETALVRHGITYENYIDITREEVVRHYMQSDLLLFASTYEGFGLPILEAQAVGRPVVTSQIWSMPEVAGESACLVDPYDIESIRAGVQRVIHDENYRNDLIRQGLENVKRFRVGVVAEQYAILYREIARENLQ
ncbi:glycosyltransferase family 4 protein [Imhoffiella purpurea]|uniref:glycosyltransferase family 4 protein n=1 Tax=Imhoffiella purpurea TaxID=1249627 RepID=UPI0018E0135D|nr:glycosyltransferase family 1 protein [Imhoffiella purpurea]